MIASLAAALSALIGGFAGISGPTSAGAQSPGCETLLAALARVKDPLARQALLAQLGAVGCTAPTTTTTLSTSTSSTSTPTTTTTLSTSTSSTSTSTSTSSSTTTTLAPSGGTNAACATIREQLAVATDPAAIAALQTLASAYGCSLTRVWTGAAPDRFWSDSRNWANGIPRNGDSLRFPGDASQRNAGINDLTGLVIRSITFSGALPNAETYDFVGNKIVLQGGVVADLPNPNAGFHQIDVPVELQPATGTQSVWDIRRDNSLATGTNNNAMISGNAGLTKIGDGTLAISADTYSGPTMVQAGQLNVNSKQLSESFLVQAGTLRLSFGADLGPVTVQAGTLFIEAWPMSSKTLQLSNTSAMAYSTGTSTDPDVPCGRLAVEGAVRLGNSAFRIDQFSRITPVGTSCVIIANDGVDPVVGTFAALPEGSVITANIRASDGVTPAPASFRISYVGADGNDVTLTRV